MAWVERYVVSGGAGLVDGTSEANAWDWPTMLTDQVAGERANVKGNITTATSFQNWSNASLAVRGYSSTIGDLETVTRTSNGAIDSTNWPVISCPNTGNCFRVPNLSILSNLVLKKTTGSFAVLNDNTNGHGTLRECVIQNDSSSGRLWIGNNSDSHANNCDFIMNALRAGGNSLIGALRLSFTNCRFTNPGASTDDLFELDGAMANVTDCQILDFKTVFLVNSITGSCIARGNSIRNCDTFLNNSDVTGQTIIENNVVWGSNAAGSEFYKGAGTTSVVTMRSNARGNFADADQNLGNWPDFDPVTLTGDPYTSSSDLTLNSTAGAGAACKAAGVFGGDLGAIQSAAAAGGGGLLRNPMGL